MKWRATCSDDPPSSGARWRTIAKSRRHWDWRAAHARRRTCWRSRPPRRSRTRTSVTHPAGGGAGGAGPTVGVIGPGRAGTGLALALARAGWTVYLHGRGAKAVPAPLALTVGADTPPPWMARASVVVLAVRDDAIRPLADSLARAGAVRPEQVVLHLSGALGQEALGPLVPSQAALGSLHPLQTIVDPERAPERLRGAWSAVEGMPRAIEAGERIAAAVYRALGRAALELARKRGMDDVAAAQVADALATDLPPVLRKGRKK